MLHEFWDNLTHNLFKPLLLFFYFGFLIPILKVRFEFPYVIYQGLTMYLLLAIGWHGGEELAAVNPADMDNIAGFMTLGFVLNFLIGILAYLLLSRMSTLRRIDRAAVAGYYGSDSAGTFATCVAVLTSLGIAFNAFMPVMLAIMEIPGCLVAFTSSHECATEAWTRPATCPRSPATPHRRRSEPDPAPLRNPRQRYRWRSMSGPNQRSSGAPRKSSYSTKCCSILVYVSSSAPSSSVSSVAYRGKR
jgi:hypothetical protein